MTIDKSALKALANSLHGEEWLLVDGEEFEADNRLVTSQRRIDDNKVAFAEINYGSPEAGMGEPFQSEQVAAGEFIAAANPAAVLALLAEIDRVKARLCVCRDCAGQGEVYSGHDSYQGHFQPPEPDMEVCGTCGGDGVLGPLEDLESLAEERDQLKAENESLRKDKDRLDALEANGWDIRNSSSPMADTGDYNQAIEIVGHWMDKPHERVIGEDYSENLRAAIDQAMKAPAYPPARPEYDF